LTPLGSRHVQVAGTWGSSQDPHSGTAALSHNYEVILLSKDISRPRVRNHSHPEPTWLRTE